MCNLLLNQEGRRNKVYDLMAPTCGALLRLYRFCCDGEGLQKSHQVGSRHVLTISCHLGLERAFSMFNLECFGRFTDDRDVALFYFQPIKVMGSQVVKSFVLQRFNSNSWTIVGKLQHNFWFLSLCCQFAAVHAECCNATGLHFLTLSAFIHSYRSFFFVAVPSSVPTSEALLPRRSSRHPPPPATPRAHSASRPRPQRSTGSDVRSLVGCHPKETLHYCWVTSVVFSSACSDSTYAGHHLLCPLLTTMLAKSRSQTEWASPQRADRRYVPPPILLCGLSDVEGFDQNCPRQGRREEHQDWGHHESVTWRATEAETFFLSFFKNLCSDRWGWGW